MEEDSMYESDDSGEDVDPQSEQCRKLFRKWTPVKQVDFVKSLLSVMEHQQHGEIKRYLKSILQKDFITALSDNGLRHIAFQVLHYLDCKSLASAELVCSEWRNVVTAGMLWKMLLEKHVQEDSFWRSLSEKRGWNKYLFDYKGNASNQFYCKLYEAIVKDTENLEGNWGSGRHTLHQIICNSENIKGVYCLQYDDQKIVSGLRDNTIKVWDKNTLKCTKVLHGHTGSVLCLQYDDNIIVTGSSDTTVRVWNIHTGELLSTNTQHSEAVLHLRFQYGTLVTCSKDKKIAVWDLETPSNLVLRRVLTGHRAAVNVVDFDQKYIVSASGDRMIKVWNTSTCDYVRTLNGHKRGIACLQYRDNMIASGSSDFTIRIWDVETGQCLRVLEGHEELVRCIRFDNKRIISGAYDGRIKIWNLPAALDPRSPPSSLCLLTLHEHTGRVFRLQFDAFQIVSSSHDDTILVWDFLTPSSFVSPPSCTPVVSPCV